MIKLVPESFPLVEFMLYLNVYDTVEKIISLMINLEHSKKSWLSFSLKTEPKFYSQYAKKLLILMHIRFYEGDCDKQVIVKCFCD